MIVRQTLFLQKSATSFFKTVAPPLYQFRSCRPAKETNPKTEIAVRVLYMGAIGMMALKTSVRADWCLATMTGSPLGAPAREPQNQFPTGPESARCDRHATATLEKPPTTQRKRQMKRTTNADHA